MEVEVEELMLTIGQSADTSGPVRLVILGHGPGGVRIGIDHRALQDERQHELLRGLMRHLQKHPRWLREYAAASRRMYRAQGSRIPARRAWEELRARLLAADPDAQADNAMCTLCARLARIVHRDLRGAYTPRRRHVISDIELIDAALRAEVITRRRATAR